MVGGTSSWSDLDGLRVVKMASTSSATGDLNDSQEI